MQARQLRRGTMQANQFLQKVTQSPQVIAQKLIELTIAQKMIGYFDKSLNCIFRTKELFMHTLNNVITLISMIFFLIQKKSNIDYVINNIIIFLFKKHHLPFLKRHTLTSRRIMNIHSPTHFMYRHTKYFIHVNNKLFLFDIAYARDYNVVIVRGARGLTQRRGSVTPVYLIDLCDYVICLFN